MENRNSVLIFLIELLRTRLVTAILNIDILFIFSDDNNILCFIDIKIIKRARLLKIIFINLKRDFLHIFIDFEVQE